MKKNIIISVLIFLSYCLITLALFSHRLPNLYTHYTMPDVDTDGGLWYQWYVNFTKEHKLVYELMPITSYPYGYDVSLSPSDNLVYSIQLFILRHMIGFSWSNLIFITNISSLITYPLSAIGGYFLCYYLTKNKWASYIAGIIFGFSFYHVFMGRGQMSINHIELIPFYFLSLLYFIDKKTKRALVLSGVLFAILFKTDAYYAFFCGIFTPLLLLFYSEDSLRIKIKWSAIYYAALFTFLVLLNMNFILSNLYLFDSVARVEAGRNPEPRNELVSVLYYFLPPSFNIYYRFFQPLGNFLYGLPIILSLWGIFLFRKNRIFVVFILCFILSVVLSTYVPSLFFINLLYFKFFSMFRSVGRIILVGYLFVGLMMGMVIANLFEKSFFKKSVIKKSVAIIILTGVYVIGSISIDDTWKRATNFERIVNLYTPIKENKKIHVIAAYPNQLNYEARGFPQPYQIIGQIIHEKTFANGADFRGTASSDYQRQIKDIENPQTISVLAQHGVDTIIIYNGLLKNSAKVNRDLKQDERVEYVDRYIQPWDAHYPSANDRSRDISVYYIKENKLGTDGNIKVFKNNEQKPLTYLHPTADKYIIPSADIETLRFTYPYSSKWGVYDGDLSSVPNLFFWPFFRQEIAKSQLDTYTNRFDIPDKYQNHTLTIFFKPAALKQVGDIISFGTFILSMLFLLFSFKRPKV